MPETTQAADNPSPTATVEPVLRWLSGQFDALSGEGQWMVDDYWARLKAGRVGRKPYDRGTLGVRLRRRPSGAFSLEWYEMGSLGQDRKPVAKRHIPKGSGHRYAIRHLLQGQPDWLAPLVEETEEVLAELRKRQSLLLKVRDDLVSYQAEMLGKTLAAAEVMTSFRSAESAAPQRSHENASD